MNRVWICSMVFLGSFFTSWALAQTPQAVDAAVTQEEKIATVESGFDNVIFDDNMLINGYATKIAAAQKDFLLSAINDDGLAAYRKAAAVRVFRQKFAGQIVTKERAIIERVLLRQLERAVSAFVQVEIMHTLLVMDRYRYFDGMVPALIQKMDHYDDAVSDLAYKSVVSVNGDGNQRSREARIVFNTLRKMFFLTRKKLGDVATDSRLRNKIDLMRWSIKVLGTDQLKDLPKEVIGLM
ncbi:MAG: hypothetical protein HQL21_05200 [Candidatus Omnitrophica bacterium]|nr:hypothetical protein [Candidatus Omnitrophota bacterium]